MQKPLFFFLTLCFLLQHFIGGAQALTSTRDTLALKALKATINPASIPSWSCLASWNFSSDPCATPRRTHFVCGLSCSSDATRITEITLDSAGYSGKLTPLISYLTRLTALDLSDNKFFGPVPNSISSLSNLQSLSLRTNSFSGSVPDSLNRLKSLENLDISHNFLSGILPNTLYALSSLRTLDLSYNKFTGSIPKLPKNLIELALRSNSLSGYIPKSSFAGLIQLEVVELGDNSFSGTLESWFLLLPALQQVDLANNSLTRVEISKPPNGNSDLVAVDLGFNKIEGKVPANFADYPLLSSLSLRYNRLRGAIPLEYGKKKSMSRLYLDGNFLIGKPPSRFFAVDVSGSLGNNCLRGCPGKSQLCSPSQKPYAVCKQAYDGKGKPRS